MIASRPLFSITPCSLLMLLNACSSNTDIPSQKIDNDTSNYTQSNAQNLNSSETPNLKPNTQSFDTNESPSVILTKNIMNQKESNSKSKYFTKDEIKDISKAFNHDSCDMTAFNQQTKKYHFNNTYGNPYVDGQDDINELSEDGKCLIVQQANIYASSDILFTDSNGYEQSRPSKVDLKSEKISMLSFDIDYSQFPSCNLYQQENPFSITFLKDSSGNITRNIIKNEYELFDCYEDAMKNIRKVKNNPVKLDKRWFGIYEYSTYEIDESRGIGYGAEYTIKLSQDECHIDIVGYQVDNHFACNVTKASSPDYINIYQLDNQKKIAELKYESPSKYLINITYYDKYEGVNDKFDEIEKTE